jgi:hypothetical protein
VVRWDGEMVRVICAGFGERGGEGEEEETIKKKNEM